MVTRMFARKRSLIGSNQAPSSSIETAGASATWVLARSRWRVAPLVGWVLGQLQMRPLSSFHHFPDTPLGSGAHGRQGDIRLLNKVICILAEGGLGKPCLPVSLSTPPIALGTPRCEEDLAPRHARGSEYRTSSAALLGMDWGIREADPVLNYCINEVI
jgi:hypothetical protein